MRRTWLKIAAGAAGLLGAALALAEPALQPFHTEYRLLRGGYAYGQVTMSLTEQGGERYRFEAHTRPLGVTSLISSDEIVEISEGRLAPQGVIPERYSFDTRKGDARDTATIVFDHAGRRIEGRIAKGGGREQQWRAPLRDGVQDKLSQQLAAITALSGGDEQFELEVAEPGGVERYRFRVEGREELNTSLGRIATLKVARQRGDAPSNYTLWLSPTLGFVPVRIERVLPDGVYAMALFVVDLVPVTPPEVGDEDDAAPLADGGDAPSAAGSGDR